MLARTPLYAQHVALGAKMVDFHGWEMPLHYGSQIEEHHAVRQNAGAFDVSHMTIVDIIGVGGRQFLRHLLTNDIDSLKHSGQALYTCMCNELGGIIDDLIVYQRAPDNYRLVLNAATREKDLKWIREKSKHFSVGLQERTDSGIIAVQGPHAIEKVIQILSPQALDAVSTLAPFECIDIEGIFFARTGYTAEDGLEMILPHSQLETFWNNLVQVGVKPCGLASRDTLRLEGGLLLYGQDMDETTSPLESGLEWVVKFTTADRNFLGMGALLSQKNRGVPHKLIGLKLKDKAIMRQGQTVFFENKPAGVIVSGGFSPTLNCSIALARVECAVKDEVQIEIRGKNFNAFVTKPRFVKKGQAL